MRGSGGSAALDARRASACEAIDDGNGSNEGENIVEEKVCIVGGWKERSSLKCLKTTRRAKLPRALPAIILGILLIANASAFQTRRPSGSTKMFNKVQSALNPSAPRTLLLVAREPQITTKLAPVEVKRAPAKEQQARKKELPRVPTLSQIRRNLDPEIFEVRTNESLKYFFFDLLLIVSTSGPLYALTQSDVFHSLPLPLQFVAPVPLQLASGFALWCM